MLCCVDGIYDCGIAPRRWKSELVWEHSPGFLSCERFQDEVFLGTYDTCLGLKSQLCKLSSSGVVQVFDPSEGVYHIRNQGDSYCYIACEQGDLYKLTSASGTAVLIESHTRARGYHDACDGDGHRYSVEEESTHPPNQANIKRDGVDWMTLNFGCKDITYYDGKLWIGAYHISNDYKCSLAWIDVTSKTVHFGEFYSGHIVCPTYYNGKVWAALQLTGGGAAVINSDGEYYQVPGNQGWAVKVVNGILLVTTTEGSWRGSGFSHLLVFDGTKFTEVRSFPDTEPWDICAGDTVDEFYLVTRNEREECGMGRVYKLTRFSSPTSSTPIQVSSATQVFQVGEPITDVCLHGDDLYLSPHLHYNNAKIYVLDTTSDSLRSESVYSGVVESVYRVWDEGDLVFAGTEQPPMFLVKQSGTWGVGERYADEGWAVLGNKAADGKHFRGWSYRNLNTSIKWGSGSGSWSSFPSLGKRIVWWIESFDGAYYAGTSSTTGYKNANDGRIYKWAGSWNSLNLGPIGGVITTKTYGDAIYFGTVHPQEILRFDGVNWDKWCFGDDGEVSKFWTDGERLFCGTTTSTEMSIRQWTGGTWSVVWSIDAKPSKWAVQGVARDGKMWITFRDGNFTKCWEIDYE